tara:strand:+ start:1354 stop:1539 length:186 start_codon:yes stop_codon:yes gene_type:complete
MSELVVAVGLFLVIEGLVYAISPSSIKKMAQILPQIPDNQLRNFGMIAIAIGVGLVWLIRG